MGTVSFPTQLKGNGDQKRGLDSFENKNNEGTVTHLFKHDGYVQVWATQSNDKNQTQMKLINAPKEPFCMAVVVGDKLLFDTRPKINKIFGSLQANVQFSIDEDGELYAKGDNSKGQFGMETAEKLYNKWIKIKNAPKDIKHIAIGYSHSAFLTKSGKVFVAGKNHGGQLGLGNNIDWNVDQISNMKQIPMTKKIGSVECGQSSTIMVDEDGCLLWCGMGFQNNGAVERVPTFIVDQEFVDKGIKISDTSVKGDNMLTLSTHGDVFQMKDLICMKHIKLSSKIKRIMTGHHLINIDFCCAITHKNEHYFWGCNDHNQCLLDTGGKE